MRGPSLPSTLHDFCEMACRSWSLRLPAPGISRSITYLGIGLSSSFSVLGFGGAEGGTRTPTPLRAHDPESYSGPSVNQALRRRALLFGLLHAGQTGRIVAV